MISSRRRVPFRTSFYGVPSIRLNLDAWLELVMVARKN